MYGCIKFRRSGGLGEPKYIHTQKNKKIHIYTLIDQALENDVRVYQVEAQRRFRQGGGGSQGHVHPTADGVVFSVYTVLLECRNLGNHIAVCCRRIQGICCSEFRECILAILGRGHAHPVVDEVVLCVYTVLSQCRNWGHVVGLFWQKVRLFWHMAGLFWNKIGLWWHVAGLFCGRCRALLTEYGVLLGRDHVQPMVVLCVCERVGQLCVWESGRERKKERGKEREEEGERERDSEKERERERKRERVRTMSSYHCGGSACIEAK